MQAVRIDLEFCYGITALKHEFDFSQRRQNVVYAPNGVMKSSLAQTFKDVSEQQPSLDRIYKDRETKRSIKNEQNNDLSPGSVLVVESYNETYRSNRMSTLLANARLRAKYDQVRKEIDEKKEVLIKGLQELSGLKSGVEEALARDITSDPKEFFRALKRLAPEVEEGLYGNVSDIRYAQIFSPKIADQISSAEFRDQIAGYMAVYDRLIGGSTFFRRGVFNHNNASDVAKSLKSNGFFKADHSVYVKNKDVRQEIKSEADLEGFIQREKDEILSDNQLKRQFEKIDKVLTKNVDMRDFRNYLIANDKMIPELSNPDRFRQRLWVAYLVIKKSEMNDVMQSFEAGRQAIEDIIEEAQNESTRWASVLSEFNSRFSVPFLVTMENQQDVILKSDAPSIRFRFKHGDGVEVPVEESDLVRILSNGEKRALYLLNIIFEVNARVDEAIETVFIFDDIADSFDYKNKYAIVEYLRDITEVPHFYQIILTHNYDFYRTVAGRLDLTRENKLHTSRNNQGVFLKKEKYQNNPFNTWKKELPKGTNDNYLIAMIPFVRNIAEFSGDETAETELTKFLHVQSGSSSATVGDLEALFKRVVTFKQDLVLPNRDRLLFDVLFAQADGMEHIQEEELELESKIVLAMAIRIKAEQFMIDKISDAPFIASIRSNQTFKLLEKYRSLNGAEAEKIGVLKQVTLMTPENIHLNSFMYEPLLDMSNHHLKRLYKKVAALT